jgi:tetratricopeptide (TPR) repeat protein
MGADHRKIAPKPLDPAGAIQTLVKMLAAEPTHEQALSMLTAFCLPETKEKGMRASPINKLIAEHKNVPALRTVAVRLCREMGDYRERLGHLEALQKLGAHGENFDYELARTLRDNGEFARCLQLCDAALKKHPDSLDLLKLRGSIFVSLGQPKKALADYQRVLALNPGEHHARMAMGIVKLLMSDCREGYEDYAANLHFEIQTRGLSSALPEWRGEALKGKRLLLWCSQGIGDIVMFASLLPWLSLQQAKVTLALYERAIPLFSRSFPEFTIIPHTKNMLTEQAGRQDFHGLLDQLMASALPDYTPAEHPAFLKPDTAHMAALRDTYKKRADGKKLVGISWHTQNKETFSQRNIPLSEWQPLFARDDIQLFSLQYGDHAAEIAAINNQHSGRILTDLSIDPLGDMDTPAAQIAAMDAVVSIQNSTVHLAGALGVPTTLMLSAASDWRWGLNRTDSHWYKSVHIERQETLLDWQPVLARAAARL